VENNNQKKNNEEKIRDKKLTSRKMQSTGQAKLWRTDIKGKKSGGRMLNGLQNSLHETGRVSISPNLWGRRFWTGATEIERRLLSLLV
jgi:hypothetical protein